jgi:DNA-binding MarR family transcriptional regulator
MKSDMSGYTSVSEMKNINFVLCNFSNVLATRLQGERARELLRERMAEPANLILNFAAVDAVAPPFLDELLEEVYAILRRNRDAGMLVLVVDANADDLETIQMVLEMGQWPGLAYVAEGGVELLSDSPPLVETLRAARAVGSTFTAPQLAEVLNLKLPAINHRLTQLVEAGAVSRRRDESAERGKRYEYRAPTDEVVSDMLQTSSLLAAT